MFDDDKDIHLSLDEAREELRIRWNDNNLRNKIETEIGSYFWPEFKNGPRGLIWKPIITPDNSFDLFIKLAEYIGTKPLAFEFLGSMYLSINEEKRNLGQLRINYDDKNTMNLIDLHKWNKKKMSDIIIKTGGSLVDFHHSLLKKIDCSIEPIDKTGWTEKIGKPSDWYYYFLLHFVAHGIWFENIEPYNEDGSEHPFIKDVTNPTIQKIKEKFGLNPLIVRLYPLNQSEEENFYWWSYPKNVNDWIVKYAKENNLTFKKIDL